MNTAVVKASKVLKGMTSTIRAHLDAVERAREIYLAQMRRAESEYFERINRATAIITGDDDSFSARDAAEQAAGEPQNVTMPTAAS
jgi:hypothetical protein